MLDHTGEKTSRHELLIGCLLLLALLITRSGITRSHFGTEFNVPDASWAVFWLAGMFTRQFAWPAVMLGCCAAVDYFAVASGTSADCFTLAYPFLIPAYLSLLGMGRLSGRQPTTSFVTALQVALSVTIGVTICFVISNMGFYLASEFAAMSATDYVQAVLRYWPGYLQTTAIYVLVGLVTGYLAVAVRARLSMDKSSVH